MIGLDATFIRAGRLTGIERHTLELILHVVRTGPAGKFGVFCRSESAGLFSSIENQATIWRCPWRLRPAVDQLWLPAAVAKSGVELVHYMTLAPPLLPVKPFLLTIHDLAYWRLPSALSTGGRMYYRLLLHRALRSPLLRGVVTVSAFAQQEIREFMGGSHPVWTVPNAPSRHFRPMAQEERKPILARYRLDRPYILAVGTVEPRKNLPGLIRSFGVLRRTISSPLELVIAGRRGWERHLEVPEELVPHVRFLGVVPDADLPALYSGAALFASSSLYEGFGLPLVEAMACGTVCVVSDLPVFREVGGEACLYADPKDPQALAERMMEGLQLSASPLARGRALQRAATFTWEASAARLLEIYDRVLAPGPASDARAI